MAPRGGPAEGAGGVGGEGIKGGGSGEVSYIHITGLDPGVDEAVLAETFRGFGGLVELPVVYRDGVTGRSRGTALVGYGSVGEAERAIAAMDEQYFHNRVIRVERSTRNVVKG